MTPRVAGQARMMVIHYDRSAFDLSLILTNQRYQRSILLKANRTRMTPRAAGQARMMMILYDRSAFLILT